MTASKYLKIYSDRRMHWAQILLASKIWDNEPDKSVSLIKSAAISGTAAISENCHAQAFLAKIYFDGRYTEKNWSKAFFWSLLARVGGIDRRSEFHFSTSRPLAVGDKSGFSISGFDERCTRHGYGMAGTVKRKIEDVLPKKIIALASKEAGSWSAGIPEPNLEVPSESDMAALQQPKEKGKRIAFSKKNDGAIKFKKDKPRLDNPKKMARPPLPKPRPEYRDKKKRPTVLDLALPPWLPTSISSGASSSNEPLRPDEFFSLVNDYVWIILAYSENGLAQGSAVAIKSDILLTNCHIISQRNNILIQSGKKKYSASIVAADTETDRCIVKVRHKSLDYIKGIIPIGLEGDSL